jgi:hypothetical protein
VSRVSAPTESQNESYLQSPHLQGFVRQATGYVFVRDVSVEARAGFKQRLAEKERRANLK